MKWGREEGDGCVWVCHQTILKREGSGGAVGEVKAGDGS